MSQKTKNFTLRLPLETAIEIMAEAKEESRSLHSHIVWILNQRAKERREKRTAYAKRSK